MDIAGVRWGVEANFFSGVTTPVSRGQVFADQFNSMLELWDALENPIWMEFLLTRLHPLSAEENMQYRFANNVLAEYWGIYQDSNRNAAPFNRDCCINLRRIMGEGFRRELKDKHEQFLRSVITASRDPRCGQTQVNILSGSGVIHVRQ